MYKEQKAQIRKGNAIIMNCFVKLIIVRVMVFKHHFQHYVSYIVAVSFTGGGNRSAWRKPLVCRKSLTNFIIP